MQNYSIPSNGGSTVTLSGTNLWANPSVSPTITLIGPTQNTINVPAANIFVDINNPATVKFSSPSILGQPIGVYQIVYNDPSSGCTATGPKLQVRYYASNLGFSQSILPATSAGNHVGLDPHPEPVSLDAADLTGDGHPDLITPNHHDDSVTALLRGPGVTTNYSVRNTGGIDNPRAIVHGDFNEDGKMDLFVVSDGNNESYQMNGDGLGGFTTFEQHFVRAQGNEPAVVVDLNNDHHLDVVGTGSNGIDDQVILFGSGAPAGAFTPAGHHFLSGAYLVGTGRFSLDNSPDLIFVNNSTAQLVINEVNQSTNVSSFDIGATVHIDGSSSSTRNLAIADVNEDGISDVAITKDTGHREIEMIRSDAQDLIFGHHTHDAVSHVPRDPDELAFGDINGDGLLDLVVVDSSTGHHNNQLTVYLGIPSAWHEDPSTLGANTNTDGYHNRDAVFNPNGQSFAVDDDVHGLVLCDFDGDGRLDIAVANKSDGNVIMLMNTAQ